MLFIDTKTIKKHRSINIQHRNNKYAYIFHFHFPYLAGYLEGRSVAEIDMKKGGVNTKGQRTTVVGNKLFILIFTQLIINIFAYLKLLF